MATSEPLAELLRFHTGEKFTVTEASRFLNIRPARVVLCVGSAFSGKTTFLARIGEMFRKGSFARYRFAGSRTLSAFERATWWATITSGIDRPDTPRTSRIENDTFLHLSITPDDDRISHQDLLISDLAGETFPTAVGSLEVCLDLRSLARADHLLVFLDCKRLIDQAQRHSECDNARAFLQRVLSVKKTDANTLHVQVIFSRWDYVTSHAQRVAQEAFCEAMAADWTRRFEPSFASIEFRRIAARPNHGATPTNNEIQSIFCRWLETPLYRPTPSIAPIRNPARDFSAFGLT